MKKIKLLCLTLALIVGMFQGINIPIKAAGENIAANKVYTASSIEEAANLNLEARNAFDDNTETRYSSGQMKRGKNANQTQTPQWLMVDMGGTSVVTNINIKFFKKVYATDYTIETSDSSQGPWDVITTKTNEPSSTAMDIVNDIPYTNQDFKRFVRFNFKAINHHAGGNGVSVRDIRIEGTLNAPTTPQEENIALQQVYSASSIEANPANVNPDQAFDENSETRYASAQMKNGNSATQTQTPQWLMVDMRSGSEVSQIRVHFYKKVYATEYTIETSDSDQGPWDVITTKTNEPSSTAMDIVNDIDYTNQAFKRFVRFHFKKINHHAGGNGVSVRDIAIRGRLLAPRPVDPKEQLANAQVEYDANLSKVVLKNIEDTDLYSFKIIGSTNKHVVANDGTVTNYHLNAQTITLLLAAIDKQTNEVLPATKVNKTIIIPSIHTETLTGTNEKPEIIPTIQEFLPDTGNLDIVDDMKIYVSEDYKSTIDFFVEDVKRVHNVTLGYTTDMQEANIVFNLDTNNQYNLNQEGYVIKIGDKVEVYANTKAGFSFASVTLAQMLQRYETLTKGIIRDYPNYEIRGMSLDVARIPMRMEFLEKVARLFRWHKLNEFHLHLNDHQWPKSGNRDLGNIEEWKTAEAAHRLESKRFPSLSTHKFKFEDYPDEFKFYEEEYQNVHYTIDEYKTFENNNLDLGLNTLAEIDTPGHSGAYSVYAVENPDNIDYLGAPISHPNNAELLAINSRLFPERTQRAKRFIRELITDYLENDVFKNPTVHLGVDEYWDINNNREEFREYLNELHDLLKAHGKTMRAWGALTKFHGTTPISKEVVFDEWAQYESNSLDRINEGYKIVNVPQPFTYITPGRFHKDIMNAKYVYDNWQPNIFLGNKKAMDGEPLLLGAKGALWGDEYREGIDESDIYQRLEVSLPMIGYKTWSTPDTSKDYMDYQMALSKTALKGNYLPLDTKSEVLVDIDANHIMEDKIVDMSGNNHKFETENMKVVELDGEKWFEFDGNGKILSDIDDIALPYTLEMTIKPRNVEDGALLSSKSGELFLNRNARRNDRAEVAKGVGFHRYFYTQFLTNPLTADTEYKLTLTSTRHATVLYVNGTEVARLGHTNDHGSTSITHNLRSSFNLPFKEIAKGFDGYVKNVKVYNRVAKDLEVDNNQLENYNIALHKPVLDFRTNSTFWSDGIKPFFASRMTDGDFSSTASRWNTSNSDQDYFVIDLEEINNFDGIKITFDSDRVARGMEIEVSDDYKTFTPVKTITENTNTVLTLSDLNARGRYVRFKNIQRKQGANEASIYEVEILKPVEDKTTLKESLMKKEYVLDNENYKEVYAIANNKYTDGKAMERAATLLATLPDQYNVRFVDSITNEEYASKVTKSAKVMTITQPEKQGYRFNGWYLEDVAFDFDSEVAQDITLEARWIKLHEVTIQYVVDGKVIKEETQTVEDNQDATISIPTVDDKKYLLAAAFDENMLKAINEDKTIEVLLVEEKTDSPKDPVVEPVESDPKDPVVEPVENDPKDPVVEPEDNDSTNTTLEPTVTPVDKETVEKAGEVKDSEKQETPNTNDTTTSWSWMLLLAAMLLGVVSLKKIND